MAKNCSPGAEKLQPIIPIVIIEFLGTAGATITPIPGATDSTSNKARRLGPPYSRHSPSIYIHGPELMIDMGEETRLAMDRAGIARVPNATFSHWHPDHVLGKRVFELNRDFGNMGAGYTSDIWLPPMMARDAASREGLRSTFDYYARFGWVRTHTLDAGQSFALNGVSVLPFVADPELSCGFLLRERDKRVVIVPDEVVNWQPEAMCFGADVLVLPQGLMQFNPISGERRWQSDHVVFRWEPTWADTLALVERLKPKRCYITHIEAFDMPDHDALAEHARELSKTARYGEIHFAHDTLRVVV